MVLSRQSVAEIGQRPPYLSFAVPFRGSGFRQSAGGGNANGSDEREGRPFLSIFPGVKVDGWQTFYEGVSLFFCLRGTGIARRTRGLAGDIPGRIWCR